MIVKVTAKRQVTFPARVLESLGVHPGDRLQLVESPEGYVLPEPDWIHIDESLEYEGFKNELALPANHERKLRFNRTPYLVPIAGDWKNRPGPEPWDPSPDAPPPPS